MLTTHERTNFYPSGGNYEFNKGNTSNKCWIQLPMRHLFLLRTAKSFVSRRQTVPFFVQTVFGLLFYAFWFTVLWIWLEIPLETHLAILFHAKAFVPRFTGGQRIQRWILDIPVHKFRQEMHGQLSRRTWNGVFNLLVSFHVSSRRFQHLWWQ